MMHSGDALPQCLPETPLLNALVEMSSKGLGLTLVLNENKHLLGIVTDGDIRRALLRYNDVRDVRLQEMLTANPKTILADALAIKALRQMQESQVTALVVVENNPEQNVIGLVHLHDLLKAGLH
jgi:arabinose-5-phosphate isomerase